MLRRKNMNSRYIPQVKKEVYVASNNLSTLRFTLVLKLSVTIHAQLCHLPRTYWYLVHNDCGICQAKKDVENMFRPVRTFTQFQKAYSLTQLCILLKAGARKSPGSCLLLSHTYLDNSIFSQYQLPTKPV